MTSQVDGSTKKFTDYYHKGGKVNIGDGKKRTMAHCKLCNFSCYAGGIRGHLYYKHGIREE